MTLELMVCPHDTTHNPERWFRFMQYLGQSLNDHLHFDISLDFADFQDNLSKADIVYANPSGTMQLIEDGFVVVARPSNLYDEVVFLANEEVANPTLDSLQGQQIASVIGLQPTNLALHILTKKGITPAGIVGYESWTSIPGALWRGEARYGLIYKDTYDALSDQGKNMAKAFYTSNECINFHTLLVGRQAMGQKDTICQILTAMHTSESGKEVLQELGIEQWIPISHDDLNTIQHIMQTY